MHLARVFARFACLPTGLVCALAVGAGVALAAPPCPTPLRVGFVDTDLGQLLHGQGTAFGEPPGRAMEIMRITLAEMGCTADWVRMPVRRLLSDLANGHLEVAVGLAADPERLPLVRFPVLANGQPDVRLAIAEARVLRFGLSEHQDRLEALLSGPSVADLRYGSLRGSVPSILLQRQGLRVEEAADVARGLAMLRLGRFDLLVMPDLLMPSSTPAEGVIPIGPPLVVMRYHAPASPQLAQQHPAWLSTFWRTACRRSRSAFPALPNCPIN